MMKVYEAWERRYWGGTRPTWRRVPPLTRRYPRYSRGPSRHALRRITGVRGKRIAGGRA